MKKSLHLSAVGAVGAAVGLLLLTLFQNCGGMAGSAVRISSISSSSPSSSNTTASGTVDNSSLSPNAPHGSPTLNSAGTGCNDQYCIFVTGQNFDSLCNVNVLDSNWKFVESHASVKEKNICTSDTNLTFALGAAGKNALLNGGVRITLINPGDKNWNTIGPVYRTPAIVKSKPAVGFMAQLFVENLMPGINPSVANAPALLTVQKKLNQKLVIDAANSGATYVTLTVPGFAPLNPNQLRAGQNDLALWQSNPIAYWQKFDEAIGMIEAQNLAYVIRDWNDINVFPTLAGDNQHEFLTNPQSKSYLLYMSYWQQLITRYAGRPGLLQIGIGGEWNLSADLDQITRCRQAAYGNLPGWCDVFSNYTTAQLLDFFTRTLSSFHRYGPTVAFASELGLNQANAYHLQQTPEWLHSANSSIMDNLPQGLANHMQFMNLFDVQGQHNYNGSTAYSRWGYTSTDRLDIQVLANLIEPAEKAPMYFGELGESPITNSAGQITNAIDQINRPYTLNVLRLMLGWGGSTRATLWGFQFNTVTSLPYKTDDLFFDFAPPYFSFLQQMQGYNHVFGQSTLGSTSTVKAPNVVIAWPVSGLPITESMDASTDNNFVAVFASANSSSLHALAKIVVKLDGATLGATTTYPYRVKLPRGFSADKKKHTIAAIAYDTNGLIATDTTTWH